MTPVAGKERDRPFDRRVHEVSNPPMAACGVVRIRLDLNE